jgi:hypothetical protein
MRPETGGDHDVEINSIATYRIHSQHKITPRHGLWNVRHLPAGVRCPKMTMVVVQFRRANGLRDGLAQKVADGSAIVCALSILYHLQSSSVKLKHCALRANASKFLIISRQSKALTLLWFAFSEGAGAFMPLKPCLKRQGFSPGPLVPSQRNARA